MNEIRSINDENINFSISYLKKILVLKKRSLKK